MCYAGVMRCQDDDWRTVNAVEQERQTLRAAVRKVMWSFSVLTSICHNTNFVNDPLRNVKPVQLRMTDRRQAVIMKKNSTSRRKMSVLGNVDYLQPEIHSVAV